MLLTVLSTNGKLTSMTKSNIAYSLAVGFTFLCAAVLLHAKSLADEISYISDGDRMISVSYEVDVLVLGGTTSGVAAAKEAARSGAKTMLITDNNYLGEDLTATLRLWRPEAKNLIDPWSCLLYDDPYDATPVEVDANALFKAGGRIDYSYSIEEPFNKNHPENASKNRLSDGVIGTIQKDSLQTDGPMTVKLDLGTAKEVGALVFVAFYRDGLCVLESVSVEASEDGHNWKKIGSATRLPDTKPSTDDPDFFTLKIQDKHAARYWKLQAKHTKSSRSVFAAGLFLFADSATPDSLIKVNKDVSHQPPRPLHVKRQLDKTLIDAGVDFLYGAFETGRIVSSDGSTTGVLISNRAGRQAIIAKQVLDLRDQVKPTLRRLAEEKPDTATVEFVVVGGDAVKIDSAQYPLFKKAVCKTLKDSYSGPVSSKDKTIISYKIHRYLFDIDREFAQSAFGGDISKYEQLLTSIRLAAFHPKQQFTADRISLLAPGESQYQFDESTIGKSREQGQKAGEIAKAAPKLSLNSLRAESGEKTSATATKKSGCVEELLDGIRPYDKQIGRIHLPGANYEVVGEYDVLVIGGGTTGAPASIAAARAGAKTLVVELQSELGGVGTLGSITGYYHGNKVGFTAEVLNSTGGWIASHKSRWWASELVRAGGEVWFGVLGAGAIVDPKPVNGRTQVKGALLATPFGPKVVLAKVIIDTTGNGDIARAAGSEMQFTTTDEITVQGAGLSPTGLGNYRMNNDYTYIDDTDPIDVTHLYVFSKVKYPNAFDQGKVLGTRERRRIVGDFVITALDQLNLRTYDDSIAQSWSDFDSHGYTTSSFLELYHPEKREAYFAYYPYRASLPRKLEGILVGALATSSHRDALPMIRMQADLQNQGYALGYIAAVAAKEANTNSNPVELRKVDIKKVQQHLVKIGNLPESVLSETDSYDASKSGLAEAVQKLPEDAKSSLLVMWHPNEALPLLKEAYQKADNLEAKTVYARALALLGDASGEKTLFDRVVNYEGWDEGWNFKGMSQFGSPSSQLDKDIMILGRLKCIKAVPIIIQKLNDLKPEDDFSHHRACYLALEWIGDPSAAKTLVDHLNKPGMHGHAHRTIEEAIRADKSDPNVNMAEKSRRDSLKEIGAARVLYRLGDQGGLGKLILEEYSKDLRGHFARHAAEELLRNE